MWSILSWLAQVMGTQDCTILQGTLCLLVMKPRDTTASAGTPIAKPNAGCLEPDLLARLQSKACPRLKRRPTNPCSEFMLSHVGLGLSRSHDLLEKLGKTRRTPSDVYPVPLPKKSKLFDSSA